MDLNYLTLPVTVLVGKSTLPLSAYHALQVGDIIVLDQEIDHSLTVRVGKTELYRVTAGLVETHKAVTIDECLYPR